MIFTRNLSRLLLKPALIAAMLTMAAAGLRGQTDQPSPIPAPTAAATSPSSTATPTPEAPTPDAAAGQSPAGSPTPAATPTPQADTPTPKSPVPTVAAPSATPVRTVSQEAPPAAALPDSTGAAGNNGTGLDLAFPAPVKLAAEPGALSGEPTIDDAGMATAGAHSELVQNIAHDKLSINMAWTLVAAFLVMFMQAGFALVETGLCRAKNAAHTMSLNLMVYAVGVLGFWACGFGLMFGGYGAALGAIHQQPSLGQGLLRLNVEHTIPLFGHDWGFCGGKGFFLDPSVFDTAIFCLFTFQVAFMDTAATIPTGALAERWNFKNFMLYGFWISMFGYSFYGNWTWGGGWLAQLGAFAGLGHGMVDFAGSTVVHLTGGVVSWVGAAILGSRMGKFRPNGKPRPIPAHNIPMVILGTLILAFGWFGFNCGSTLSGTNGRIAIIAVNTMLASAAGALSSALLMWFIFGKPDPSMFSNGLLAGLVAITAPCAFVSSAAAVLIGAVAGLLVVAGVFYVEHTLRIDDPVGAISVHAVNGAWGAIALGLMANGSYGQGWNGVHVLFKAGAPLERLVNTGNDAAVQLAAFLAKGYTDEGVTGCFGRLYGAHYNDWSQCGAEAIGCLTNILFVGGFAFLWFKLSHLIIPFRSRPEDEASGLDMPEMGAIAYPDMTLAPDPTAGGGMYPRR